MKVTVLGGTGVVGHHVVEQAGSRGHDVRVVSRGGGAPGGASGVRCDLTTGDGLDAALAGADVVIDTANADVSRAQQAIAAFGGMARRVTAASARVGVGRLVVLSIVGIDDIPYGYYRGKVAQEQAYRAGEVPVSILRTTQFHEFAGQVVGRSARSPVVVVPKMLTQPVAAADVATVLLDAAEHGTQAPPELGGPEVRQLEDLAKALLAARGSRARVVPKQMPGRAGKLMATGALLPSAGMRTTLTFDQWLAEGGAG